MRELPSVFWRFFSVVTVECIAGHIGHSWNELASWNGLFLSRLIRMTGCNTQCLWMVFFATNHEETLNSSDVATILESSV